MRNTSPRVNLGCSGYTFLNVRVFVFKFSFLKDGLFIRKETFSCYIYGETLLSGVDESPGRTKTPDMPGTNRTCKLPQTLLLVREK